jgi:hypothetical protein
MRPKTGDSVNAPIAMPRQSANWNRRRLVFLREEKASDGCSACATDLWSQGEPGIDPSADHVLSPIPAVCLRLAREPVWQPEPGGPGKRDVSRRANLTVVNSPS